MFLRAMSTKLAVDVCLMQGNYQKDNISQRLSGLKVCHFT